MKIVQGHEKRAWENNDGGYLDGRGARESQAGARIKKTTFAERNNKNNIELFLVKRKSNYGVLTTFSERATETT